MAKVYGDWEMVEENHSRNKNGILTNLYRCKNCGETQLIGKYELKRSNNTICINCTNLFYKNMEGKKFGRLKVIQKLNGVYNKSIYYKCECDCGKIKNIRELYLLNEDTTSCGCFNKDRIIESNTKHGLSGTRIYSIYLDMKRRCYNPNRRGYKNYGARGINMCDEWLDKHSGFMNFYNWSIENGYTDNLTIDRIDNDGPYSPDNCRWVTMVMQQNNRSNNHLITHNNIKYTIPQLSNATNLDYMYLYDKITKGSYDISKILKDNNTKIRVISFSEEDNK